MHRMIASVCRRAKIPGVSLPDEFFIQYGLASDWQCNAEFIPAFKKNIIYYGFRNLPDIFTAPEFDLATRKSVLLVRDPRDALVSRYYSFGRQKTTHALPKKNAAAFLEHIAQQPVLTIDEYVLKVADEVRENYEAYRTHLNFDLTLVRNYEDIYFDKETFLGEIFGHFGIGVAADVIARVARDNDIRPEKEDDTKHIRKGMPGDHAEKLQPATIARLNDTFREVGAFYGYDL